MTPEQFTAEVSAALEEVKAVLPVQKFAIVGSCFILSPTQAKDADLLILLPEKMNLLSARAQLDAETWHWAYDEGTYPSDEFESGRKGLVNLLLVNSRSVFDNWRLAAMICKALNLTNRDDRVIVHQILMDGLVISSILPIFTKEPQE